MNFNTKKLSINKVLSLILAISICVLSVMSVNAAITEKESTGNSAELNHCTSFLLNPDNAYRFGLENFSGKTAGILRQTLIRAYIKKGEAAYFGSSTWGCSDGNDISVTSPDGIVTNYDVIENGQGDIASRAMETAGLKNYYSGYNSDSTDFDANTQTELNSNGYTPFCFVAQKSGVYVFEFHSKKQSATASTNIWQKVTSDFSKFHDSTSVAAWDVSIVNNPETIKNTNNIFISGRVYTNYLALNAGLNGQKYNFDTFVLTDDGFIYDVKLHDIDPYGFIFFANNQGLTTTGFTPSSIYHSVYCRENSMAYIGTENKITYHSPNARDTYASKTFKVFFEKPNEDLENILYSTSSEDPTIKDLKFKGYTDNHAYYSQGGMFSFVTQNASTATLKVDFSKAISSQIQKGGDEAAKLQKYLDDGGSGISIMNGAVKNGTNTFYWDGTDTNGKYVPVSTYGNTSVKISATPKAGEIHFPLFDVETFTGGLEIERINHNDTEEAMSNKDNIFFNNSPLVYGNIEGQLDTDGNPKKYNPAMVGSYRYWQLSDGTYTYPYASVGSDNNYTKCFRQSDGTLNKISTLNEDGITHTPVDSSIAENRMRFERLNGVYATGGDMSAIDTWTYYTSEASVVTTMLDDDITIDELPEELGTLRGRVFYDNDNDGKYDSNKGDYLMSSIPVTLCDANGNVLKDKNGNDYRTNTDISGVYTFLSIPQATYYVNTELSDFQKAQYTCSTHSTISANVKTVVNSNSTVQAEDIGYHTEEKSSENVSFTVHKNWVNATIATDTIRAELWAVEADSSKTELDDTYTGYCAELADNNNWKYTFTDLPTQKVGSNGIINNVYYYVKEYYEYQTGEIYVGSSKQYIGESDPDGDYNTGSGELTGGNTDKEDSSASKFKVSFTYTKSGLYDYVIEMYNQEKEDCYKVIFHRNFKGNSSAESTDYFRVYYPSKFASEFNLTNENKINAYYSIPDRNDEYIFKGWYYDADNNNDTNPIKWDTDVYPGPEDTHIYAHWIEVGSTDKDANDTKKTGSTSYKGYDLIGVQIRNALKDPNYPDGSDIRYDDDMQPRGLRFVTIVKESILSDINTLFDGKQYANYTDNDISYGYVIAKTATAAKYLKGTESLEYKDQNVNGVDTSTTYKFALNVECTSKIGGYITQSTPTNIVDHRNFSTYRLYTTVITYKVGGKTEEQIEQAKAADILARSYLRYTDSNGLLRTFYNNYGGTCVRQGCSTNYTAVYDMMGFEGDVGNN